MDKTERARVAREWADRVSTSLAESIKHSIDNSTVYVGFNLPDINLNKQYHTDTIVCDLSVEEAVKKYAYSSKACVLNFASYKDAGGRFMDGLIAQEEALCHSSTLYPVLRNFNSEYFRRRGTLNGGLYNEDFIYTPDIAFIYDKENMSDIVDCDVLNYAAPCMIRKQKDEKYINTLKKRMVNAFLVPYLHDCDTVILGAWGCGVFSNDPALIASIWKSLGDASYGLYKTVVHPVPIIKNDKNYKAFYEVFN